MPLSFISGNQPFGVRDTRDLRVLVTGAAGRIGSWFAEHAAEKYKLRLLVHHSDGPDLSRHGEIVQGDIEDPDAMRRVCEGIDTVIHLAGNPNAGAGWDTLLGPNIIGAYTVMMAAKDAGCRRLIFASSIHAVSGHPSTTQVKSGDPVCPGDLYGVTKCFGEALGRLLAVQHGLSVIALRIGAFQPPAKLERGAGIRILDAFVSERDLTQLICRCVDVDNVKFAIFNGLSGNRFNRLDISDAIELLGYEPQDDSTELHPALHDLHLRERLSAHNDG